MERIQELAGFIHSWNGKPRNQVVSELASYSLETKLDPDPYHFTIRSDGKLISPLTNKLVEDSVEKISPLGYAEWQALQKIQQWDKDKDFGLAFWFSPPHPERSKFTKLIVSEIQTKDSGKLLFNRSLLLEIDATGALGVAKNLALASQDINFQKHTILPESLRSHPVFVDETGVDWVEFMENNVGGDIWEKIRSGKDISDKELAIKKSGVLYETIYANNHSINYDSEEVKYVIHRANSLGFFGKHSATCPPLLDSQTANSSFGMFIANSEKSFPCPNCHRPIPSSRGITKCPHCGATKEEYGSNCD